MKRKVSYASALAWIAGNDRNARPHEMNVASKQTVAMVADLFAVPLDRVVSDLRVTDPGDCSECGTYLTHHYVNCPACGKVAGGAS